MVHKNDQSFCKLHSMSNQSKVTDTQLAKIWWLYDVRIYDDKTLAYVTLVRAQLLTLGRFLFPVHCSKLPSQPVSYTTNQRYNICLNTN